MKKRVTIGIVILLVFAVEIYCLSKYSSAKSADKLSFVLTVIGFYGVALGFIKRSTIGKTFTSMLEDMTSPNPALFIAGNFTFMGLFLNLVSIAFDKNRDEASSLALGCFGTGIMVAIFPLFFLYVLFHLIIILPLAYPAYVISSAIVETICGASGDIEMTERSPGKEAKNLSLKNIISSDREASKSFLIGVPALLISFALKTIAMFYEAG